MILLHISLCKYLDCSLSVYFQVFYPIFQFFDNQKNKLTKLPFEIMKTFDGGLKNRQYTVYIKTQQTPAFYRKEDVFCSWKSCFVEIDENNLTVLKSAESRREIMKCFLLKDIIIQDVKRYGARRGFKIIFIGDLKQQKTDMKKSNRKVSVSGSCYHLTFQAEKDCIITYSRLKQRIEMQRGELNQNKENVIRQNFCQSNVRRSMREQKQLIYLQSGCQTINRNSLINKEESNEDNKGSVEEVNNTSLLKQININGIFKNTLAYNDQKLQLQLQGMKQEQTSLPFEQTQTMETNSKVQNKLIQSKRGQFLGNSYTQYVTNQQKKGQLNANKFKQSYHLVFSEILKARSLQRLQKKRQKLLQYLINIINQQQKWNPQVQQQNVFQINNNHDKLLLKRQFKHDQTSILAKAVNKAYQLINNVIEFNYKDGKQYIFGRQILQMTKNSIIINDFLIEDQWNSIDYSIFQSDKKRLIRRFIIELPQSPQLTIYLKNVQHLSQSDKILIDQEIDIKIFDSTQQQISGHVNNIFTIKDDQQSITSALQICLSNCLKQRESKTMIQ